VNHRAGVLLIVAIAVGLLIVQALLAQDSKAANGVKTVDWKTWCRAGSTRTGHS
jgi:hypothetical protein